MESSRFFVIAMQNRKCYHNAKAYISYPVPSAHKSKTYKYIDDSEIHAFNYNNRQQKSEFQN